MTQADSHQPRFRVMVYVLDADADSTASLGIFYYTCRLLRALAAQPDPGFDLVVLDSSQNHADVFPDSAPRWMSAHTVQGRFGGSLNRLWADHVLSLKYARQLDADLLFFPKGWVPIAAPRRLKIVATMHDTMNLYYKAHYPEHHLPLRTKYWIWNMRRTCQRADLITANSCFTRESIMAIGVQPRRNIQVIYPGPGLEIRDSGEVHARKGILVIGSRQPHKATRETLFRLEAYMAQTQKPAPVYVTGLSDWPTEWGAPPSTLQPDYLGRVSEQELCERYQHIEALVFLSHMEGFGLPVLEALAHGAAVCYRSAHALQEIFGDGPCAWDGRTDAAFFTALDNARQLGGAEVHAWYARVNALANWTLSAEQHLSLFGAQGDATHSGAPGQ